MVGKKSKKKKNVAGTEGHNSIYVGRCRGERNTVHKIGREQHPRRTLSLTVLSYFVKKKKRV